MCRVNDSASIMGYGVCCAVGEEFVCIVVLKVCVDFGEVVSCVQDAHASTFITWFDYYGLVILEIVLCCLFFCC